MFKKILIANRGEIALRVMRSCKNMGINTVAVYSDADENAPFVLFADEAACLGPPPSNQSYLLIDKIIEVCQKLGVDAVHPGYGFLSENAEFSRRLEAAGITFIGPKPHAVQVMGDKITSKNLAEEVGVPCIKGHNQDIPDAAEAVKIAEEIGYPVMVKAAAGGGGKGMRIVRNSEEMAISFGSAKSEATNSFGDGRVFMEKFVENPRHIEIQVLFDSHGTGLHLNERECSIQRRNQKIIEEAPSTALTPEKRAQMGASAVQLGQAVDYLGAGTVEFMMDAQGEYYFLEMNTRLQVEHPVTEMTTGVDLVEWQIRIADGQKLDLVQADLAPKGWAFESRVYSEDPSNDFLPSIGTLRHYQEPQGEGVRVDSGVLGGNEITLYYDPMIAKLVTYGKDRQEALGRMLDALARYEIGGVVTNIGFLSHILKDPDFVSGDISTKFIETHYPDGFENLAPEPELVQKAILLACWKEALCRHFSLEADGLAQLVAVQAGQQYEVEVVKTGAQVDLTEGGKTYRIVSQANRFAQWMQLEFDGQPLHARFRQGLNRWEVTLEGMEISVECYTPAEAKYLQYMPEPFDLATADEIYSPMPGKVLNILAQPGDHLKKGQPVLILEAMKMENSIMMNKEAQIKEIRVTEGDSVENGQLLVLLEPEG